MALLTFSTTGTNAVQAGIVALMSGLHNLQPFWIEEFAPKYLTMVQDLFSTSGRTRGAGGRFAGGAWAWLTPKYAVWKSINYPNQPILTRTGRLRESLRWQGSGIGPEGVFMATPTNVSIGTGVPYAKFHQYGTKKMVARPFLPPPDATVWAPMLTQWLAKQAKAAQAAAPEDAG